MMFKIRYLEDILYDIVKYFMTDNERPLIFFVKSVFSKTILINCNIKKNNFLQEVYVNLYLPTGISQLWKISIFEGLVMPGMISKTECYIKAHKIFQLFQKLGNVLLVFWNSIFFISLLNLCASGPIEEVIRKCSVKNLSLKISQDSQENTFTKV